MRMDSYGWGTGLFTFAFVWLLNVLMAALAYKLHIGYKPIPMPPMEFAIRNLIVGSGLAAMLTFAYLVYCLTAFVWEAPDAVVNSVFWVLLMAFLPAGVAIVAWGFDLEDFFEGVSVFLIQSFPIFLLLVLTFLFSPVRAEVTKFIPIRNTPVSG
jgi:hypothetical protein